MEVCPLSCEVMLSMQHVALAQLLSVPLQNGIRFFHILISAPYSASLAVGLPIFIGTIRTYRVLHKCREWVRFCLFAGSIMFAYPQNVKEVSCYIPFWSKPVSVIWLVRLNDIYQQFAIANHTIQPSPPVA